MDPKTGESFLSILDGPHLIQTDPEAGGVNILVDCGIAQGHDPVLPFDKWPVAPSAIDYLFLTHAHIDHTGRVPDLIDAGFSGEIICTHATRALLFSMLRDAMSFSDLTDVHIRRLEARIDDLAWEGGYVSYQQEHVLIYGTVGFSIFSILSQRKILVSFSARG